MWLIFVIVLYVAAAVLPFMGLWGIFAGAREEAAARAAKIAERDHDLPTLGDSSDMILAAWSLPQKSLDRARRDLWLIGIGLGAGCVASIWSLFL
ncbi:hypothetical protein M768_13815 [Cellulosimicrobium cellulans F16]|uniref:Uncharacterized protein n=1 Tax=Cellulosimicrobium cellulans F16 TaxID=1350482 RepID=A0A0M0F4S3_CELCE|nr:hypothetical protein [Cellulosimicrobium cellulans]KON72579.1 hypothetical protein M768_13815 [Cellulosimicrobium cellulans F16]